MKLLKLVLSNLKGVKAFTLEPNGQDATVYGENGTGKSTLMDAMLWLLFDKNQNFKAAAVKTLDVAGQEIHGLDHSVEGSFLLDDGKTLTLKKVMAETWTKKRGTADKVFTGHSTDYWVDEVPLKLKEYKAQINSLVPDEELFKLLSSPFYFASVLPWAKRRETLLKICGDVSDQDVISSSKKLSPLTELLGNHSIDEFKKIITSKLSLLNKEIQEIPVRIDEASLLLPDLTGLDLSVLKKQRTAAKAQTKTLSEQLQGLTVDSGASATKDKIARLEFELTKIKNQAEHDQREAVLRLRQELNTNEHQQTMQDSRSQAGQNARNIIVENKKRMAALRHDYTRISEKEFILDDAECCLTCGQTLPEDTQETAFNTWKSQNLEKIQTEGKALTADNEKLALVIEIGTDAARNIDQLKKENIEIGSKIDTAGNTELTPSEDYLATEGKIAELEACLKDIETGTTDTSATRDKLKEEKTALQEEVETLKEQIDKFTTAKDIRARVKALGHEERILAGNYEEIEGHKFLIESFIRAKVEMLEGQIVDKLGMPGLSVKMFEPLINSGLSECCKFTYNGVPFGGGLNRSQEIRVGLALIDMLGEHHGINIPCFVDNYECCTHVQATKFQLIKLIVSEKHKKLTISIDSQTAI